MFGPDANMPRLNHGMVYLGACLIAGIRLARERQVGQSPPPGQTHLNICFQRLLPGFYSAGLASQNIATTTKTSP